MADNVESEARLFARYLVRRDAGPEVIKLYGRAVGPRRDLNPRDRKLLDFMLRHPHSIGLIDAGLILGDPYSEVRRRLYIMFAILEASPDYADCFLTRDRSWAYILFVGYSGVRGIIKTLLGSIFVKVIAR